MFAAEAPKITDWMQAWASVAGLVMSTTAVLFTGLLLRHEIRVRQEEQRDNEAAQARLVFARPVAMERDSERTDEIIHVGCLITNYSSTPVFDLTAELRLEGNREPVNDDDALFPVMQGELAWEPVLRYRLPDSDLLKDDLYCVIHFVDSAGLYWRRVGSNPPTRSLAPTPGLASRLRTSGLRWFYASLFWLHSIPVHTRHLRRTRSRTTAGEAAEPSAGRAID